MATRTTPAKTALLLCSALTGCDSSLESLEPLDASPPVFRALTTERDNSFELMTWPREATGPAMRSEGYLIVRLQSPSGSTGPANPPNATDIQGTCGVTFVSPTLAVTAGHCLPNLNEGDEVEVRVARVLPGTDPTGEISGTFPTYTHPSSPGYAYDRYTCEVRSRCYFEYAPINCTITPADVPILPAGDPPDIGMLECQPVDGGYHDYVNVTETVAVGDEVAMPWYHELYDPLSSGIDPAEFDDNYMDLPPAYDSDGNGRVDTRDYHLNYHYHGGGVRHEMLPLMSADYYGSTWDVKSVSSRIWTNLRGCHGTSGSGVMKKNSADYPELIGPVTNGDTSISVRLCQTFNPMSPGGLTIATTHPDITRYFVDEYLPASCDDPDSFPNRLAYWFDCDILRLGDLQHDRVELFPWDCPSCPPFAQLVRPSNIGMEMSTEEPSSMSLRAAEPGAPYRAGVRVWLNAFPTTVELRMGNQVLAEHEFVGQDTWVGNYSTALLSGSFVPTNSTDELTIAVQQGSAAQEIVVSDVVLVQDGAAGAFETMHSRFGFGLVDAYDQQPVAKLMSFGGSVDGGIAALLDQDERMVATGYALVADQQWTITPIGDEVDMQCGMIFADGHEIAQPCYGNEPTTLDAVGHGEPLALFVQNTEAGQGPISLSDFVVEQGVPASCTPPAHDRCETGVAMAQPSCDPCVESICTVDPYCCSTSWDSICVGEVSSVCNESCSTCAHEPCQTGAALESGCDGQQGCVTSICNADPYCCATYWDSICVGEVGSICGQQC